MRHGERARHDSEAKAADRAGHHEAVIEDPLSKSNRSKDHRQGQADLMDPRRTQDRARSRNQPQQNRGSEAMHEAKSGNAHGNPVQSAHRDRKLKHDPTGYRPTPGKIQHYIYEIRPLPHGLPHANRRSSWIRLSSPKQPQSAASASRARFPNCSCSSPPWFSRWSSWEESPA